MSYWHRGCSGLFEYAEALQADGHPVHRPDGSFLDTHHLALARNGGVVCPGRKSEHELQLIAGSGSKVRIKENALAIHVSYHSHVTMRIAGLKLNPDWKTDESALFPTPFWLVPSHY